MYLLYNFRVGKNGVKMTANGSNKEKDRGQIIRKYLTSTKFLTYDGPAILGIAVFVGGGLLGRIIFGHPPSVFYTVLFSLIVACFMFGGVFTIIRREAARRVFPAVKGFWAVFSGWFTVVICGILELLIWYFAFIELTRK